MSGKQCEQPPMVLSGIFALMTCFNKYAAQDPVGPKDKLSRTEAKALLQKELGMMPQKGSEKDLDKIIDSLDFNKDGELDFTEFMMLCCAVACSLQDMSKK